MLDAAQVLLPGIFVVTVVWIGARFAVEGRITSGELVAFYGYAAFLMLPLRTITEFANKLIRGIVAARRVTRVLRSGARDHRRRDTPRGARPDSEIVDVASGLVVPPGLMTAVVCDPPRTRPRSPTGSAGTRPARSAGGTCRSTTSRAPSYAAGSSSPTRRRPCSPAGSATSSTCTGRGDEALRHALSAASVEDILETLPEGMDALVTEGGRTFSGGQRQRLVLARILALDPEVLVLVEPTSAVDAHTEARIAERLHDLRRGRTTVVMASSPLAAGPRRPGGVRPRRSGRRGRATTRPC